MELQSQAAFEVAAGRALARHASDVVLLMRQSGELVFVNDAAQRAYGMSADELVGRNVRDLRAPATLAAVEGQIAAASKRSMLFETEHLRRDGTAFPVEVGSQRVEIDGVEFILSVVRDISARRAREAERDELLRDLESANHQLEGLLSIVSSTVGRVHLEQLLSEVLHALREVMDADGALLFVVDGDLWRIKAEDGFDSLKGLTLGLDQGFVSQVAVEGGLLFVPDVRDAPYALPEHEALGVCAMLGVPLYLEGSLFGVLECTWRAKRLVSESEQVMLRVAADRIMTAVAGATRYEVSLRVQALESALSEASAVLSGTHDLDKAMPVALEIANRALDSDVALFGTFEEGVYDVTAAVGAAVRSVLINGHPDLGEADAAVVHVRRKAVAGGSAEALLDGFGLEDAIVVPVEERGEWYGAIVFGRSTRKLPLDDAALAFAERFASMVAATHAKSRDYEAEHRIAETLQEALLRVDHDMPGIVLGHLYRSATLATRVGGDFYDIFTMPGGRIGVLVGDVSGKGLDAAVLTTFVKHTIRAFAHTDPTPAGILRRANEILLAAARVPEFATVLLLTLDPDSGEVDYCSAGHPPAIVRRADGTLHRQECGSPVIGALPGLEYVQDGFILDAGDTVVLYTDGVTEARCANGEFFGDERLMAALEQSAYVDAAELPDEIHRSVMAFTTGRLSDDIAIVAFRRS